MSISKWLKIIGAVCGVVLLMLAWVGYFDALRIVAEGIATFARFTRMNSVEAAQWVRAIFTILGFLCLLFFLGIHKEVFRSLLGYGELKTEWSESDKRCSSVADVPRPNTAIQDRDHYRRLLVTNPPDNSRSLETVEVFGALKDNADNVLAHIRLRLRDHPEYTPTVLNPGHVVLLKLVSYHERPGLDSYFVFGPCSHDGAVWQAMHLPLSERYDIDIMFTAKNMFPVSLTCAFGIKDGTFYFLYDV